MGKVLAIVGAFVLMAGVARADSFGFDSVASTPALVQPAGGRATVQVSCDDANDWATGGSGYWTRNGFVVQYSSLRHILSMIPLMAGKQVTGYQFNVENDNPSYSAEFTAVIVCGTQHGN